MPLFPAVLIGGLFALVALFATNLFFRRAPFWVPIAVGVASGLIVAFALLFWFWSGR